MVKKLRIGDKVDIPDMNIDILLTQPTSEEQEEYQADKVEKERIAKLVKEMNKGVKKIQIEICFITKKANKLRDSLVDNHVATTSISQNFS